MAFFARAPVYGLPIISGALLMQIENRPLLATESVHGETHVVQPGTLEVEPVAPSQADADAMLAEVPVPMAMVDRGCSVPDGRGTGGGLAMAASKTPRSEDRDA